MKNLIQMYVKFNKSYFTKVVLYFKYFFKLLYFDKKHGLSDGVDYSKSREKQTET